MSIIWDSLIELQNNLISQLEASGTEVYESGMERFNQPGWVNRVWSSDNYRRAHVDVVDMREQKKRKELLLFNYGIEGLVEQHQSDETESD